MDMCHHISVLGLGGRALALETPCLFQNKGRQVFGVDDMWDVSFFFMFPGSYGDFKVYGEIYQLMSQ